MSVDTCQFLCRTRFSPSLPRILRYSRSFSQYVSTIEWLKTRLTAAGECRDLVWKGAAALMYVKNELPLLQLRAKALVARREL